MPGETSLLLGELWDNCRRRIKYILPRLLWNTLCLEAEIHMASQVVLSLATSAELGWFPFQKSLDFIHWNGSLRRNVQNQQPDNWSSNKMAVTMSANSHQVFERKGGRALNGLISCLLRISTKVGIQCPLLLALVYHSRNYFYIKIYLGEIFQGPWSLICRYWILTEILTGFSGIWCCSAV